MENPACLPDPVQATRLRSPLGGHTPTGTNGKLVAKQLGLPAWWSKSMKLYSTAGMQGSFAAPCANQTKAPTSCRNLTCLCMASCNVLLHNAAAAAGAQNSVLHSRLLIAEPGAGASKHLLHCTTQPAHCVAALQQEAAVPLSNTTQHCMSFLLPQQHSPANADLAWSSDSQSAPPPAPQAVLRAPRCGPTGIPQQPTTTQAQQYNGPRCCCLQPAAVGHNVGGGLQVSLVGANGLGVAVSSSLAALALQAA